MIDFDTEQLFPVAVRLSQILKLQLPTFVEKSYINPLSIENFLTEIFIIETEKLSQFDPPSTSPTSPISQAYTNSNMASHVDPMGAIIAARYVVVYLIMKI